MTEPPESTQAVRMALAALLLAAVLCALCWGLHAAR